MAAGVCLSCFLLGPSWILRRLGLCLGSIFFAWALSYTQILGVLSWLLLLFIVCFMPVFELLGLPYNYWVLFILFPTIIWYSHLAAKKRATPSEKH